MCFSNGKIIELIEMPTQHKSNGALDGSKSTKLDTLTAAIDVDFSTGIAQ